MKIELVDVCGQTDTINKEVEQLKKKGDTEDEIKQVKEESEKHEEYVKSYWDWHNKVYK